MENPCCAFDSFDALYKCSCNSYLCPKHHFSHKKEFSDHNVSNIRIAINKKSREILANFIIKLKQKCVYYANQLFLISSQKNINWNHLNDSDIFMRVFQDCNRIYLYLMQTKYVSLQLCYSPITYFLISDPSKAEQYIKSYEIPENIPEDLSYFYYTEIGNLLIDFNYFIFEHKCPNGWNANNMGDKYLLDVCRKALSQLIRAREYEMAYELTQNMINSKNLLSGDDYDEITDFLSILNRIIYKLIEEEKFSEFQMEWVEIEKKLFISDLNLVLTFFYQIFSDIFQNLNNKELAYYCIQTAAMICWKNDEKIVAIGTKWKLGGLYCHNGENEKALKLYKELIRLSKKFAKDNVLLLAYLNLELGSIYYKLGKAKKILKLLESAKRMEFLFVNKNDFYEIIGIFYLMASDWDNSIKYIWKALKRCEKYKEALLYRYLSNAYYQKNDLKKAFKMIFNAKSCLGVFSLGDQSYKDIYDDLMRLYINSMRFKEALECYELSKNHFFGIQLQKVKFLAGKIYYELLNYEKSLELFIEVSNSPEINKSFMLVINSYIGHIYYQKNDYQSAQSFFMESFKLIKYYDFCEFHQNLLSFTLIFDYFWGKNEYKKCEVILSKAIKLLENKAYERSDIPHFLILKARLYYAQNQISNADSCLNEAEEILNIKEILLHPQRTIKFYSIFEIRIITEIAGAYITLNKNENYLKGEAILKYCESVCNVRFINYWFLKAHLARLFGELYWKQARWSESKICYKKALDLLKLNNYDIENINTLQECINYVDQMNKLSAAQMLNYILKYYFLRFSILSRIKIQVIIK